MSPHVAIPIRSSTPRCGAHRVACSTGFKLVVAILLAGCRQGSNGAQGEPAQAQPQAEAAPVAAAAAALPAEAMADVDAVLHCSTLAPGESLAVRLLGTIGPNGAWSLRDVHVEQAPGRIVITPEVNHVTGQMVIQMVMPLDRTLHLKLEPGMHRIEVRGREGTQVDSVRVTAGAQRPPPETRIAVDDAPAATALVTMTAEPGDGFVERIEYRELDATGASAWREAGGAERRGRTLVVRLQLPAGRVIEARAVDGQGGVDPTPASATLP
ncbi:MAG: hypothetical protein JSW67_04060 [Candidatus Latescibacterota bacterium]|nr:MAG: hypothetical protein JSW67_04060 [Candidatus Latescibacterota bacterium]